MSEGETIADFIIETIIGNRAKFLNHSTDPNCRFVIHKRPQRRLVMQTIHDVKMGDELTFDYGYDPLTEDSIVDLHD